MIHLFHGHERNVYPDLFDQMHQLRARVFADRLGWDVKVTHGREQDEFDDLDPLYAMAVTDDGVVVGGLRLLQTTGPNMLRDVFSEVLPDGMTVRSPLVWESTRFCVDTSVANNRENTGLTNYTGMLLTSLYEIGLQAGLSHIVTVLDVRMERILRRAHCPMERLGEPTLVGSVKTLAILMPTNEQAVETMRRRNNITTDCISQEQWQEFQLAA